MFRTVPLSIIRSFSLYTHNGICRTGLLTACEQDQDGTPDDGQRNCPKLVEFYSKNKFLEISASTRSYHKNLSRCILNTCLA